jgi:hypothetical protein
VLRSAPLLAVAVGAAACATGCRDLSRYSSGGDSFEGPVVKADFVRANVGGDTRACITLDTDHLQDGPGRLSTSDGRFHAEPLRPIPQVWHDPISTLSFGEGREKNLVYVATPTAGTADAADTGDVLVVVSLMTSGGVEVRLLRGAPGADAGLGTLPANVFGVFQLVRQVGPCSY